MIVLVHSKQKIVEIESEKINDKQSYFGKNLTDVFIDICNKYPEELIVWVTTSGVSFLNKEELKKCYNNKIQLNSFSLKSPIPDTIGYVDQSIFININKKVKYPTWIMADTVGAMHAEVFNQLFNNSVYSTNFNQLISSIAKMGQPLGLLTYSNPSLISKTDFQLTTKEVDVFSFVKKHYKLQWLFILFFNLFVYEKKISLIPFLKAIFIKKGITSANLTKYTQANKNIDITDTIDVVIPTIGRAKYIETVFNLLAKQTHLPSKVIVVEQNAVEGVPTELNFIYNKIWPFKIEHQLIYQLGACNARNLALEKVESKYTFLADDDIEFDSDFIQSALSTIKTQQINAATLACLRIGDKPFFKNNHQWGTFGSGCSIVKTSYLKSIKFNTAYEFGFGEDADYGMQLRNKGCDVFYLIKPQILHLKAPIGGFRTKFDYPWDYEVIKPKPSPTVMLFKIKYLTAKQKLGYKTTLFTKFYKNQNIKNPITYIKIMQKKWQVSVKWANVLNKK